MSKKTEQARNRQPRVPAYPPAAQATAQRFSGIIDAGGEQSYLAYALLSRLAVFWSGIEMSYGERQRRLVDMIRCLGVLFPDSQIENL